MEEFDKWEEFDKCEDLQEVDVDWEKFDIDIHRKRMVVLEAGLR